MVIMSLENKTLSVTNYGVRNPRSGRERNDDEVMEEHEVVFRNDIGDKLVQFWKEIKFVITRTWNKLPSRRLSRNLHEITIET